MNNFYNSKTSLINGEQKFSLQFKGSVYTEKDTIYLVVKDILVKSNTAISFTVTVGSSDIKQFLKWQDDYAKHKSSDEYYINYHKIDATLTQYDGDDTKYYSIKYAYPVSVKPIENSSYWDIEFIAEKIEKLYNKFPIEEYTSIHSRNGSDSNSSLIESESNKEEHCNDNCFHMPDESFMNHRFKILFSTDYVSAVQYHVFDLNISTSVLPGDVKYNIEFNIIAEGADANHFQRWFRDVIRYNSEVSPRLNYKVDAILVQYGSNDKIYKRYKVYNAYPISIAPGFCVDSIDYTFKFTAENVIPWGLDEDRKDISAENIANDLYIKNENNTSDEVISPDPITWDDYFMNVAILTSLRSKDKNTKVGATLVDSNNRIIGCGYNGLPSHLDEYKFPTSRDSSLPYNATKYAYVVHAELNSILNTTVYNLNGSKIYSTLFPCNECAKVIIQKGISEVIYLSDKYHDDPIYIASRKLLDNAGIPYRQYTGKLLVNNI